MATKLLQNVLFLLLLLPVRSASVDLYFLLKESRPSSSVCEYFFLCQVVGKTLQWEANNQSLTGLGIGQTGVVRASTRGTLVYSAVFLEDKESGGQHMLTSILIISTSPDHLQVTCLNDRGNTSTSTATSPRLQSLNRIIADSSNTIILQHIFSTVIVQSTNASKTHCFLCRVQLDSQLWAINNRLPYGFSKFNNIGDSLPSHSSGEPIAEELAFLHAKNPIYTMLLVTESLPLNVSCSSNQHEANLFISDDTIPTTQQTPPTIAYTSPLTYSNNHSSTSEVPVLVGGTKNVVHNNNIVPILAGSVAAGALVFVVVLVAIFLVVICNNSNVCRRKREKEVSEATNPTVIQT